MGWTEKQLRRIHAQGLFRSLKTIEQKSGTRIVIFGKRLVNFCSNDYLGLANDPRVKKAGADAIQKWGAGAAASRLVSGNFSLHLELEQGLAGFKGAQAGLLFSSGYLANIGAIPALVDQDDQIFSDQMNHASLIDACRLSKAKIKIFPHSDLSALNKMLSGANRRARKLIVAEGIYSMDGDLAPLPEILELAEKFGAMVYLDEAHSTGVIGKKGKGALEYFGIKGFPQHLVLMGTLSKALAGQGGFICGPKSLRELLINRSRAFIFSTGLNPAAAASALKSLEIIEQEPELVARLQDHIAFARKCLKGIGLKIGSGPSPILPIVLRDPARTLKASQNLFRKGFFVQPIRPPSVPSGTSRLRITVCAAHSRKEIERLAETLSEVL